MKVKHTAFGEEFTLIPRITTYSNGDNAIVLYDEVDGLSFCKASISIEGLESDEVAIKNYSENAGILESLIRAEIITKPHRYTNQGHVEIPICKLLINPA